MSKYSIMMNKVNKLEEAVLNKFRQDVQNQVDDLPPDDMARLNQEYFQFAHNDFTEAERTGYSNYSYWGSAVRMFFKNKVGIVTFAILLITVGFSLIQPLLPGQVDPTHIHNFPEGHHMAGMFIRNAQPGEHGFFMGSNAIGQDMWARIWAGTRNSLFIGLSVALISMTVGIIFGMLWGYVRQLDFFFTEFYNIVNNIPQTIILLLASIIFGPSIPVLILAMCFWGWIGHAHGIRNLTLIYRDREFNLASRCLGTGVLKVVKRNLLPQMVSVIMLRMALAIPAAITAEVFLSYLGLGISAATPTLGNLLETGRGIMLSADLRYQLLLPAAVLSVIAICFYLAGNAFSDSADPRNHV